MSSRTETVLQVEGMTCRSCVRHVDEALRGVDGVGEVEVRFQEKTVRVGHDLATAPVSCLVDALREAGYESAPKAG